MKRSPNNSCAKSKKRWTAFSWFLFGLILFTGLGHATTINDVGINNIVYAQSGDNLQQKIGNCPTNTAGCEIILSGGIYTITDTLLINRSGVTLRGVSLGGGKYDYPNPTLIQASGNFANKNMINITGYRSGISNIYVNGSSTTGDGISVSGGANFLDFVHVNNQGQSGIVLESGTSDSETYFQNVWSGNNGNNGLEINRADLKVTNYNGYRNWNGSGIYIASGNNKITNSEIWANKHAVYILGGDENMFVANTFAECLQSCFYFDSSTGEPFKETITANNFHKNSINQTDFSYGSTLASTYTGIHPLFYLNDSSGNGISSLTITANTIDDTTHYFNYTGGSNIEKIIFALNVYQSRDLGQIPNNTIMLDASNNDLTIGNGINNPNGLITLLTERAWSLKAGGSAGSTSLDLKTSSDGKEFRILGSADTVDYKFAPRDIKNNSKFTMEGNLTMNQWVGTGNALACFRADGTIYRGNTTGCP